MTPRGSSRTGGDRERGSVAGGSVCPSTHPRPGNSDCSARTHSGIDRVAPHHVRLLGVPLSHLPLGASRVPERLALRQMPMFPCLLFCAEDKTAPYMRAVHDQVHSDILKMWKQLLCFCCQPPVLQQNRSEKNPDWMFLTCSKKKCKFFHWGNHPLSPKYKDWLEQEARTPVYLPTSTRDAEGYPLHGVDVAGSPPRPRPRFETGIDPSAKEALVVGSLERRLNESLKTDVPVQDRPLSEYERLLIEEIRQLKKDAAESPPSLKTKDSVSKLPLKVWVN